MHQTYYLTQNLHKNHHKYVQYQIFQSLVYPPFAVVTTSILFKRLACSAGIFI
uniref:Uncharacterized protein n=1 Tax=Anguilla anguilla TaxID=7936 RepID=A0A0E9QWZ2_ANGAN